MNRMSQSIASMSRSMKIFLRDKAIFGSSVFIPMFFLLLLPFVMFQDVPAEIMPSLRAYTVIAMVVLLISSVGVSNLAGSIAGDRDHGLYSKLSSMPVSPWFESLGRILTVMGFSFLGSIAIILVGVLFGAEFTIVIMDLLWAVGIAFFIAIAAAGIGLMVGSFVKTESAAAHVGVAIVLANYFIGTAIPYAELPDLLKPIARISPFSSGNNMIAARLLNPEFIGYNPWNILDLSLLVSLSVILLVTGLMIYCRFCWRK
ncbi:MAG: hypothetical protein EAX95_10885 [Candidatus Thorarchaeota archaeon]|nr:hypothetical protein [Candidatus Thorarchaeota archaeon]